MKKVDLRVLQVSTSDIGGGAEKIAWDLHRGYVTRDIHAWLAVGRNSAKDSTVFRIPHERYQAFWIKLADSVAGSRMWLPTRFRRFAAHLAKIHHRTAKKHGYENFYFPGSRYILRLPPQSPNILHCHNLHGGYFDLRVLPYLCSQIPVMMTLHDSWVLSGYCTYALGCERWKAGCGDCPQTDVFPVQRDGSAFNWQRKQRLYARSRFYIATPSQWLMKNVEQSILVPALKETRVIYNGIDLTTFCPANKTAIRQKLGIPDDATVIFSAAAQIVTDLRKDYQTMKDAVELLGQTKEGPPLYFIALGAEQPTEQIGRVSIHYIPFQREAVSVAQYYQAADIYIHAALADNLPTTILEALACGTPVIATSVGGIPEQIDQGETGFLVPPKNPVEMASAIQQLLQNNDLRHQMSRQAVEVARKRFDVNRMVTDYLAWYQQILSPL